MSCCRRAIRKSARSIFLSRPTPVLSLYRPFNNLPIKTVGDATVYLHDVAYVHRGSPPQTNIVLVKGKQAVLIEILKSGDASTLAVVDGIKKLPGIIRRCRRA